jgi:hypothetical protein
VGYKNSACRVEVGGDMVGENLLDDLLRRLVVFRDLLESFICWSKDRVICSSSVQDVYQVWVFIDELCQLRGVLAASNELVDGLVWLVGWTVAVVRVMRLMRSVWLVRFVVGSFEDIDVRHGREWHCWFEPSLHIELRHGHMAFESRLGILASIDGVVDGILGKCYGILESLFNSGPGFFSIALKSIEEGLGVLFGLDDDLVGELLVRNDECT